MGYKSPGATVWRIMVVEMSPWKKHLSYKNSECEAFPVESSREFGIRVQEQAIRALAIPIWGCKCGNTCAGDKSSRNKGSEDEMSWYEPLVWIRVCNHDFGKQLQEIKV